jgi:formate C-acetyltransferase
MQTAALPDGRRAGEPLGNTVGARTGMDRSGPTAMLRSVASMPLRLAIGGPSCNLRLSARLLADPEQRMKIVAMIRGYFLEGGIMAQITPVDTDTLRKARETPEHYADLIVRVGGYSAKFVELAPEVQDEIVSRG